MGVQNWVAADPNGYAFLINVYQGKETSPSIDAYKDFGVDGSVVMRFLDELETKYPVNNFSVYLDSYFT